MFEPAKISTTAITSESSHRTIGWCSTCGREINQCPANGELERPLDLSGSDTVNMTVLIDGNKGVAIYQRYRCVNFRAYDLPDGNWGFFATDGLVTSAILRSVPQVRLVEHSLMTALSSPPAGASSRKRSSARAAAGSTTQVAHDHRAIALVGTTLERRRPAP